jgi:hypothetical protein
MPNHSDRHSLVGCGRLSLRGRFAVLFFEYHQIRHPPRLDPAEAIFATLPAWAGGIGGHQHKTRDAEEAAGS